MPGPAGLPGSGTGLPWPLAAGGRPIGTGRLPAKGGDALPGMNGLPAPPCHGKGPPDAGPFRNRLEVSVAASSGSLGAPPPGGRRPRPGGTGGPPDMEKTTHALRHGIFGIRPCPAPLPKLLLRCGLGSWGKPQYRLPAVPGQ